jgi:uncharacterized membrane protein
VLFDFHPIVFAAGIIPWLLLCIESKRVKPTIVCVLLLLLTQENMGIALISIGCLYVLRPKYRKMTIAFFIVGVLYSVVAVKIIGLFSPGGFDYMPRGNVDIGSLMSGFFDHPDKRLVWWYALSAFTFLPLFSIGTMLAILADLFQYFIAGPWTARYWSPFTHHHILLGVLVAAGTIEVLVRIKKRTTLVTGITFLLLVNGLAQQYIFHFPLNKLAKRDFWKEEQWMGDDNKLLSEIPSSVSVATQQNLVPHLSHRKQIYLVWPVLHDFDDNRCGAPQCWWLDVPKGADVAVLDTRPNQTLTQVLETGDHFLEAIHNMQAFGAIVLQKNVGYVHLYKIQK